MIGESRFLSRGSSNIIRANWMSPARHCQSWLFFIPLSLSLSRGTSNIIRTDHFVDQLSILILNLFHFSFHYHCDNLRVHQTLFALIGCHLAPLSIVMAVGFRIKCFIDWNSHSAFHRQSYTTNLLALISWTLWNVLWQAFWNMLSFFPFDSKSVI